MQIAIVIPCYNEENRLEKLKFQTFLHNNPHIFLCFVNDGSVDNTSKVLQEIIQPHHNAQKLDLEKNSGKAEAVRTGILHLLAMNTFDFVGFWDADLATPLQEIPIFIQIFKKHSHIKFVLGSRVKRLGANVTRIWYRHYLSRIFATFTSLTLALPVYDTQCGAKIVSSEIATQIFHHHFSSKWFFDIELLFRAKIMQKINESFFYEYPVSSWIHKGESKLKMRDFFLAPFELLKLFWLYRIRKKNHP